MFEIKWTHEAISTFEKLRLSAEVAEESRIKKKQKKASKQAGLFKQLSKCLENLKNNPRHPGLQSHAYESLVNPFNPDEKVWISYVQNKTPRAYRVFWVYGPDPETIIIIAITPHP